MKRRGLWGRLALLLLLGLLLFLAWGTVRTPARVARAAAGCTCALERERSGWCEACALGFVGGRELASREVYDALDAHGHDVDLPSLACASCRAAAASDGFCARCGRGFVAGRAYLSRLAYHLARGEPAAVAEELRLLDAALAEAARCELCAAAMVIDGTCPECRLAYRGGRASSAPSHEQRAEQ